MFNEKILKQLTSFGFRKRTSATEALIYCTEKIRNEINDKRFVSTAYLDLSKSFDFNIYEVLYSKCKYLGFNEKAILPIKSFTQDRLQKTIVNNVENLWHFFL